jgi:hypothetical protein
MRHLIPFFLIAGISTASVSTAAHAGTLAGTDMASDTHNPLTTGFGPPVDQDWGLDSAPNDTHNPLTTGFGPPVDQDWGIDSAPNDTHNPLTTGFGPPVK